MTLLTDYILLFLLGNYLITILKLQFRLRIKHEIETSTGIDHFTVVSLVTWPWIVSEAGVDLVLIETSLLFICKSCCSHAN